MPFAKNVFRNAWMSSFQGCVCFLNIVEPYMPDRVLRQFGYTQSIPTEPIAPIKACRSANIRKYNVLYPSKESNWAAPDGHILSQRQLGERATPPSACTDDYMGWYIAHTHPRVQNPNNLPRTIPIPGPQQLTSDAVTILKNIYFNFLEFQ